jgi:hypothetical protein
MRLPDFIIGGAPRSGTSWLYAVADRHPEVAMAKPLVPEPKFFLRDELYARGLSYYSAMWFEGLKPGTTAGEKSTNYLESAVAAERIHQCLPEVRLVFVLRNPIDRAFSNYLWSRQNGLEDESFELALDREEDRERTLSDSLRYARPHALVSRGLYADHLLPYFDRFSRDQILVLRYEDIGTAPGSVAESLHRFLGVSPRARDGEDQGALNAAVDSIDEVMDRSTRDQLSRRFAGPNRRLYALLGPSFPVWPD